MPYSIVSDSMTLKEIVLGRANIPRPKYPIFKDYTNENLAAGVTWYIQPVDDNETPVSNYAPFDSFQIQNASDYDVQVSMNGSTTKRIRLYAGCGVIMTGHFYESLQIKNLDSVNQIDAGLLNVQVGIGIQGELK